MTLLTKDSVLHFVDGRTGTRDVIAKPPVPDGVKRWELAMVANFRNKDDLDILLQATNEKGYRTGRYLAAYTFESLRDGGKQYAQQRHQHDHGPKLDA